MTNSYKICLWEISADLPEPLTFEAAGQTVLALQGIKAPANPKFVDLAEQLLKSRPSQVSDPLKDAQTTEEKLFCLNLPPANRVELIRLIVDTANVRGLAVFDDQMGIVFLPSGKVLPEERALSWTMLKEQMDSDSE